MTVETDFHALLTGHAPLAALVDDRVALNAADEAPTYPLVVFNVSHAPITDIGGTQLADQCTVSVECWAETALAADEVADAVAAAVATAPIARGAAPTSRASTFDPQLGLDSTTLTFDWWG